MSKYDELAQAIVDYEMIGYYDLIDAYDNPDNAFAQIKTDLEGDIGDVTKAKVHYESTLFYEEPDDDEAILLNRIIDLCKEIEHEYDNKARDKFVTMVNTYRALGYRMVVFDAPNGASWLCAFDTKGIDADHFIEAFANEDWLNDLHDYASWSGPIEDIEHMDVTDDEDEMIGGYDYYANFPVMQLATY